jgi:hypothetical protein
MPGKMARSAPRPPCGLPEVPITVRTSPLSCRKAGKAPIFRPVRESYGESRFKRVAHAFRPRLTRGCGFLQTPRRRVPPATKAAARSTFRTARAE